MNPNEIHLIEPYVYGNGAKRKKHWMEIADEEALYFKMIQEAIQQQNAANAVVGPAGAGGVPEYNFFNPTKNVAYTCSIKTAAAPMAVTFYNLSAPDTTRYCTFTLAFGNGVTSSDPNYTYTYLNTGSYSTSLTASSLYNGTRITSSAFVISASKPTVTSAYTYTTSSATGKFTASFTLTSTNSSQIPTTTYRLYFGNNASASVVVSPTGYTYTIDANTTVPANNTITHNYFTTGSITASLDTTGSFNNIAAKYTQSWYQS